MWNFRRNIEYTVVIFIDDQGCRIRREIRTFASWIYPPPVFHGGELQLSGSTWTKLHIQGKLADSLWAVASQNETVYRRVFAKFAW